MYYVSIIRTCILTGPAVGLLIEGAFGKSFIFSLYMYVESRTITYLV